MFKDTNCKEVKNRKRKNKKNNKSKTPKFQSLKITIQRDQLQRCDKINRID